MKKAAFLIVVILSIALIAATACGGDDDEGPARRPSGTTAPAATVAPAATLAPAPATDTPAPAPKDTPVPAAPAATAPPTEAVRAVSLDISVEGDALKFTNDSFTVSAGSEVVLTFENASGAFQHNWVLVKAGTKDEVATRGTAAGPANDWIQPDDPDVIENVRLLDPGETGDVGFTAPPPGTYQFVCTFPGHNFTMFGDFEVTG